MTQKDMLEEYAFIAKKLLASENIVSNHFADVVEQYIQLLEKIDNELIRNNLLSEQQLRDISDQHGRILNLVVAFKEKSIEEKKNLKKKQKILLTYLEKKSHNLFYYKKSR